MTSSADHQPHAPSTTGEHERTQEYPMCCHDEVARLTEVLRQETSLAHRLAAECVERSNNEARRTAQLAHVTTERDQAMEALAKPFSSARELNLAHANERGPWPALYHLIDAYERLTTLNQQLTQRAELAERVVEAAQRADSCMWAFADTARHQDDGGCLAILHHALAAFGRAIAAGCDKD